MEERKRRAECDCEEEAAEETHYINYEEVEASYNHGYEYVDDKHMVKNESSPLLRAIFKKYGDITIGNDVKSSDLLSTFLERICHIYERLDQAECLDLTRLELHGMISELRLLKRRKLNVGWILERVECKLIELMDKEFGAYEKQVESLQEKISSIKAELLAMKEEAAADDDIKEDRGEVRSTVRRSTRVRKQPGWHEAFWLLDSIVGWNEF